MEFHEWLSIGINNEWVSDIHCDTHDGIQMTDEESEAWDEGSDPCIPILRIW